MLREAFYEHPQYKAKDKITGKWVEGFYSCITDDFTPINIHFITTFKKLDNGEIIPTGTYSIIPESLCRNTGTKDKNGNYIWEYDICNCPKRGSAFTHCVVIYNPIKARFDVRAMEVSFPMMLDESLNYTDISINGLDYEVIGNYIDTPEAVY